MSFSLNLFRSVPVMGIARGLSQAQLENLLPAYAAAGLNTIEITLDTPDALMLIGNIKSAAGTALQVGAGTVRSRADLDAALKAGASFIVTPVLNRDVIRACVEESVPVFPGAYTPTEIFEAHSAGATMVKVFPASMLGPDYIRQIKAPLRDVLLMPTGGVDLSALKEYRKAGADAYGIGTPLFTKELLAKADHAAWLNHFRSFADVFTGQAKGS